MSSQLLPPNASKFERSLDDAAAKSLALPVPVRDLWSPDNCPAGILPWLAWSLSIEDWDTEWTEAQKRRAVAESVQVHRRKGTVGAVKRALSVLGYEVEIDEDTGQVYTFNVRLKSKAGDTPTLENLDDAERLIENSKNVRSHLLNVGTVEESESGLEVTAYQIDGELTLVWPEIVDAVEAQPQMRILSAEQTIETTSVAPDFETSLISDLSHAVAAVANYTIKLIAEVDASTGGLPTIIISAFMALTAYSLKIAMEGANYV